MLILVFIYSHFFVDSSRSHFLASIGDFSARLGTPFFLYSNYIGPLLDVVNQKSLAAADFSFRDASPYQDSLAFRRLAWGDLAHCVSNVSRCPSAKSASLLPRDRRTDLDCALPPRSPYPSSLAGASSHASDGFCRRNGRGRRLIRKCSTCA